QSLFVIVLIVLIVCARFVARLDLYFLLLPVVFFAGPWHSLGRRWYYLLFVPIFLAVAFWRRSHFIVDNNLDTVLLGLYLIVTGILDHLLLVRSLPGLQYESND